MKSNVNLFSRLPFERKPSEFEKIEKSISNKRFLKFRKQLPYFHSKALSIETPIDDFKFNQNIKAVPQFFILEFAEQKFIVNTGGFNYCRYIVRINQ